MSQRCKGDAIGGSRKVIVLIAGGSSEENSRKQSGSSRTANLHCNYSETLRSIWKRPSVIKIQFRDRTMTPGGGPYRRKSEYFNICEGANGKLCKLTPVAALTAFNTLDGKKKILHQSIGKN